MSREEETRKSLNPEGYIRTYEMKALGEIAISLAIIADHLNNKSYDQITKEAAERM